MERWMLLSYFGIYFTAAFVWRSWQVWRQTGRNPYVLPSSDDAQGYVAKAFRYVLLAMGTYLVVQACWPPIDDKLGMLDWLALPAIRFIGWSFLLLSLAWVSIAQIQMGQSWRIGIDHEHRTTLVQTGLFSVSRNPIFLAMRVSLLGLLMIKPNALTLAIALCGELMMQLQVRQEEAFLLQSHGKDYTAYCLRTRRWI